MFAYLGLPWYAARTRMSSPVTTERARYGLARLLIAIAAATGRLPKLLTRAWFRRVLGRRGRVIAWRSIGAQIGENVFLGNNVWMRTPRMVSIGAGSKLGGHVWIEGGGTVTIGCNTIVNDSDLFSSQHDLDDPKFRAQRLFIEIGDHVWMPRKIIVLPGVRIGNCAVIGTGSVVASDIPAYGVAAGNPARVIKQRARVDFTYVPANIAGHKGKASRRRNTTLAGAPGSDGSA